MSIQFQISTKIWLPLKYVFLYGNLRAYYAMLAVLLFPYVDVTIAGEGLRGNDVVLLHLFWHRTLEYRI